MNVLIRLVVFVFVTSMYWVATLIPLGLVLTAAISVAKFNAGLVGAVRLLGGLLGVLSVLLGIYVGVRAARTVRSN